MNPHVQLRMLRKQLMIEYMSYLAQQMWTIWCKMTCKCIQQWHPPLWREGLRCLKCTCEVLASTQSILAGQCGLHMMSIGGGFDHMQLSLEIPQFMCNVHSLPCLALIHFPFVVIAVRALSLIQSCLGHQGYLCIVHPLERNATLRCFQRLNTIPQTYFGGKQSTCMSSIQMVLDLLENKPRWRHRLEQ